MSRNVELNNEFTLRCVFVTSVAANGSGWKENNAAFIQPLTLVHYLELCGLINAHILRRILSVCLCRLHITI
jgi:hypothetical protein